MDSPLSRAGAIATLAVLTAVPFAFVSEPRAATRRVPMRPAVVTPATLVVPDVEAQAYVFAKSALEDAGLAWRVSGRNGFAANTVVAQSPAPGTRVVDTGAPLVTLKVEPNRAFPQRGRPDNRSPYRGTALRFAP